MATKLKLVTTVTPRPFLEIVKELQLDSVVLPETSKTKSTKRKGGLPPLQQAANDGSIPESGRNNTLMSMAGAMRSKGMSEIAIEAALQAENLGNCKPPLDPAEVSSIAKSVMRYTAADQDQVLKSLTDTGNAARFSSRYANSVRYVFGMGWVVWDELRWQRDQVAYIMELAKALAKTIHQEAAAIDKDDVREAVAKHAKASLQAPKLKAMIELAQSEPALVAQPQQLDAHDMLLGVANGVVNLKTGKLRPAQRDDLMTMHSPVAFDSSAKCPQFLAFINQVTGGDKQLANYLQRVVGYSLTGMTVEQCLFFLYGKGANGKSTFLNVVKALGGSELAKQTPCETLMVKRTSATNDIARLQNVRIVIANEVEDGSLLAESLVKNMTGGEAMAAKFHYAEYFEFVPKFKLFIAGNHKPTIRGRDEGIWRRIRLVPFVVTIPPAKRDKHLQDKLLTELPGILNWAIKGCIAWQKSGLAQPSVVTDAVNSYREEMDVIGQWLGDCCKVGPQLECKASEAYNSYKYWSEQNGYRPMAAGTFGRDFGDRFRKVKRNDGNYFEGVQCRY
jgi:putative DNA primase/helicase